MFSTYTLYKQLIYYLPRDRFLELSKQYETDKYVKRFDTWSHFLVLIAAQVRGWKSLRAIETGFKTKSNLIYHLGINSLPKRSNLSKANESRDYRVFEGTFYEMLDRVGRRLQGNERTFRVRKDFFAFDSTIITLCLEVFPWATFRRGGGFKVHTGYHLQREVPVYASVTHGNVNDISGFDPDLSRYKGGIIVFDKGYFSGNLFRLLDENGIIFVTRLKKSVNYEVLEKRDCKGQVLGDYKIRFTGKKTGKKYLKTLRLVVYKDSETQKTYEFICNQLQYSPRTIAYLYKKRWDIELFFKWIKQNLKIKKYLGTSENAVNIQVWVALTTYLLITYVRIQCGYKENMLSFTRTIRELLFDDVGLLDIANPQIISPEKKSSTKASSQLAFDN